LFPSLACVGILVALPSPAAEPETICVDGDILTGEGLTEAAPQRVSALAVRVGPIFRKSV
jgi:hypothetical protein